MADAGLGGLEPLFVRGCGGLDEHARCQACGGKGIYHGHIDLGGVNFYDNYFSLCGRCLWAGHRENRRGSTRLLKRARRKLEVFCVRQGTCRLWRVLLELPRLRPRRDDIALLVEHFRGEASGATASTSTSVE